MSGGETTMGDEHHVLFRHSHIDGQSFRDSTSGGISASTWRIQHLPSTSDSNTSFNPSQHYFRSSSSASQSSHASTISSIHSVTQLQGASNATQILNPIANAQVTNNNNGPSSHPSSPRRPPKSTNHYTNSSNQPFARQSSYPAFLSPPSVASSNFIPTPASTTTTNADNSGPSNFFLRQFSHPMFMHNSSNANNATTTMTTSEANSHSTNQPSGRVVRPPTSRRTQPYNAQQRRSIPGVERRHSCPEITLADGQENPLAYHAQAAEAQRPSFTSLATSSSFTSDVGTFRRYWRCFSCKELDLRMYRKLLVATLLLNLAMMITEILRVLYIVKHASHFDHITADKHADHNGDQVAFILSLVATILTFSNCASLIILVIDPIPRIAALASAVTLVLEFIYIIQTVLYFDVFTAQSALIIITVLFLVLQLLTAWLCYRVWEFSFFNYETNAFQTMQSMLSEFQNNETQFWGSQNSAGNSSSNANNNNNTNNNTINNNTNLSSNSSSGSSSSSRQAANALSSKARSESQQPLTAHEFLSDKLP
jgi:hypothetical protein